MRFYRVIVQRKCFTSRALRLLRAVLPEEEGCDFGAELSGFWSGSMCALECGLGPFGVASRLEATPDHELVIGIDRCLREERTGRQKQQPGDEDQACAAHPTHPVSLP